MTNRQGHLFQVLIFRERSARLDCLRGKTGNRICVKTNCFVPQQSAVAILAAVGGLITIVNLACAQPLQPEILFSFKATNGASPYAGLTLGNDGNFYGTTSGGGAFGDRYSNGYGTVFRVTTNGVLTTLISFAGTNGAFPYAGLTLGNDGNLYGTTGGGGAYTNQYGQGAGTVFRVATNGVLTTLVHFADTNGANPRAGLTLGNDGNFYGTTLYGGAYTNRYGQGAGTVFRVTTNGVLTTLVHFAGTNGANPLAGLTLGNDGNFYGTTLYGGTANDGTVFQVTTDGVLTTLASFAGTNGASPEAT